MKNLYKIIAILLMFCFIEETSYAQDPVISYKIEKQINGCYNVYYQTSVVMTNRKVSSAQISVVAPTGTGLTITGLTASAGISFSPTASAGSFNITPYPSNSSLEYLTFGLNAFNVASAAANTDILLFSFCLTGNCPGTLRLINGVSPFSPYIFGGTPDTSPVSIDLYNSMSIDKTGVTLEGYQGNNYGGPAVCPPDLTTTITPSILNTVIGASYNYTITASNIGSTPTTGSATETISIPTGLTYNSGGGNGWTCSPATGPVAGPTTVTCTNPSPNLAANVGNSSFLVNVTPTQNGSFVAQTVVGGGGEVNTTNNAASSPPVLVGCGVNAGVLIRN